MVRLLHCKNLDASLKHELRKLVPLFSNIRRLEPTRRNLSMLKYNRNNQHYKLMMNLCKLLYHEMMPTECGRETEFRDFLRNEKRMAVLFEKFVRNFYRKELPHAEYFVHAPLIQWNCDPDFQNIGLEFLPDMRTDLVVENSAERKQLIIDTKYYPQALRTGNYGTKEKLISGNLYQIYTYASNSDYPGEVSAMLLYPTVERELNLQYRISGHIIQVKTLNLGADWTEIHQRLIALVKTGNHPEETPK
jgi:5-methylcytosine-specific restriction enzyme subunit McrC